MKIYHADLAVVGAGAAGLATALHALQLGIGSVILLEKRPYPGGNAAMAGGSLFGAETVLQKQVGNTITRESAVDDILRHHNYDQVDVSLIRTLVENSAFMLDWLSALGCDYQAHVDQTTHTPKHPSKDFGYFRAVTQKMASEFCRLGGTLLTQASLDTIDLGENGKYLLKGSFVDESFRISAGAVSLSTGGFLGNQEMMRRYFPHLQNAPLSSDAIPLTGDGVEFASSLGAQLSTHCTINMHGMNSFDKCYRYPSRLGQESPLWVNRHGHRFVAEQSTRVNKNDLGNAVYTQPGQLCYALFDHMRIQEITDGVITTRQLKKVDLTQLGQILEWENKNKKWVCISDDWSDIARWMGADAETLSETIETYNQACAAGVDNKFGKEAQYLIPLLTPPFVALKCVPVTIDTYGPVKINNYFQVLDKAYSPIPGLFAAGVLTSGWQGHDYYPGGSSIGFSITGGLLAAKHISQYLDALT